jgi:hypothetical protein
VNFKQRSVLILTGLIIAVALVWAFLSRRGELASEKVADAPVVAPRRLHAVDGPLGSEAALVIDSSTLSRLGIETRPLVTATDASETISLAGELVADPGRTTTVQAPIAGRLVASAGHWPVLGEQIRAGQILGQVSDARPFTAPRAGTVTGVSAQPGEIVQSGQVLVQLTDLSQLLARIVWRADSPANAPATLALAPLGRAAPAPIGLARLIGPAADVDSLTRAPVYLYRVLRSWPGARPGAPVIAMSRAPGSGSRGVLVPTDAVVQWQALSWAYVQHGRGRFVRRRVDTSEPAPGGWLLLNDSGPDQPRDPFSLSRGDTVVVRGAQILLSEEFRAQTHGDGD